MSDTEIQHDTQTLRDEGPTEPLGVGIGEGASRSALQAPLRAARAEITKPGYYLIYEGFGDKVTILPVTGNIVRIGRSLNADIRFEDPTVSRRHALILRQGDEVRVVDDRSRNGVYIGGEQVSSSVLADGDELTIGRHRIIHVRLSAV
jgi:pSer/pThr/pTyr-binding forkhead associated (FHA) protein